MQQMASYPKNKELEHKSLFQRASSLHSSRLEAKFLLTTVVSGTFHQEEQ
jgi:hypothetical protein